MKLKSAIFSMIFTFSLLSGSSFAADKVVVIPLMGSEQIIPFSPIANDSPTNSSYTENGDGTVTDNVTGLIWLEQDDNTTRYWSDAWDYCQNNEALRPGEGWRLPSYSELISIVYFGAHNPAINSVHFPGTNPSCYWSATTHANATTYAFNVNFYDGTLSHAAKNTEPCYVRCVREGHIRANVFKDNGNGTVTDQATGLTWQRLDDKTPKPWAEAESYCQGLPLAGGGWRLPSVKELKSILDERVKLPAIDSIAFQETKFLESKYYWASTIWHPHSDYYWGVSFHTGHVYSLYFSDNHYVRCVR